MSEFEQVAKFMYEHMEQFSDHQKLALYGLYKQATQGNYDANTETKTLIDRYKANAWKKNMNMSKEDARARYLLIGNKFKTILNRNK